MSAYSLFYWSAPFRGQFVRAVLAHAGQTWDEPGDEAITDLMQGPVTAMPTPFMGPPILVDHDRKAAVSQTAAIILYLGETLALLPDRAEDRAITLKLMCDANDVIDELTLDGGRQMWTDERWRDFHPRLCKWMRLWEEIGRRYGLSPDVGWMLGGQEPGIADVITATLWGTLIDRFPSLAADLEDCAPMTAALTARTQALPRLSALADKARADYGTTWSGGRIEQSLRRVLGETD